MGEAEHLVRRIYVEAASACGDDVLEVDRYVERRLAAMSPDEQRLFRSVADRVLAFQPPAKRPERDH